MKKYKNGVYILHEDKLFSAKNWSKRPDPTIAQYVVLMTDYCTMKIDKEIKGEMPWEDAMKYSLPDRVQGLLIGENRDILKPAVELIGGEWSDSRFWTKTEYYSNYAWLYYGFSGYLYNYAKYSLNYVRSVSTFSFLNLNFINYEKVICLSGKA